MVDAGKYSFPFSRAYLSRLEVDRVYDRMIGVATTNLPSAIGNNPGSTANDRQILVGLEKFKAKSGRSWPMKRDAIKQFASVPELRALRLYSSAVVQHIPVRMQTTTEKPNCRLCYVPEIKEAGKERKKCERTTFFMCNICMIPLCRTSIGGSASASCFSRFHERINLLSEQKKVRDLLIATRTDTNEKSVQRRETAKRARMSSK